MTSVWHLTLAICHHGRVSTRPLITSGAALVAGGLGLLGYSLRQSIDRTVVPPPLRQLHPLLQVENGTFSAVDFDNFDQFF